MEIEGRPVIGEKDEGGGKRGNGAGAKGNREDEDEVEELRER